MDLTLFPEWFREVNGFRPYPWQERLLHETIDSGQLPDVLDLPTGSGKTSVIDVALFALAARPDTFPRRLVYIVDRRLIVSQTADHARRLVESLTRPGLPASRAVADALDDLVVGPSHSPLAFAELRGGIALNEEWGERPDQPAVLVSTVDQVGSRLLFRGYGLSRRKQPMHAGLLGNDALFLLDEVHLSRAFAHTLDEIRRLPWPGALPRRWQVVSMSATPGGRPASRTFALSADDLRDPTATLTRRVMVTKRAFLHIVGTASAEPPDALSDAIPEIAVGMPGVAVGVVVNRVETARRVAAGLRQAEPGAAVYVLTGRMRPLDRERIWREAAPRIAAGRTRTADDVRCFVVATQAIEAGADLDLDAMVTEIAPLDALRQRFGRVDRRGELSGSGTPCQICVVAAKTQTKTSYDDVIYGSALRATWQHFAQHHADGFDAGPLSTDLLGIAPEDSLRMTTTGAEAPLLMRHHMELLWQTNPAPTHSPDVDLWLHGMTDRTAEVQVVWRADVDALLATEAPDPADVVDVLSFCPPRSTEAMPLPIAAVTRWLSDHGEVAMGDLEGVADRAETSAGTARVLRWRGEDSEVILAPSIRPGDTIVVPIRTGGITDGVWDPTSTTIVTDLGDQAQRRRVEDHGSGVRTLRFHPDIVAQQGWEDVPRPLTDRAAAEGVEENSVRLSRWLENHSLSTVFDGRGQVLTTRTAPPLTRERDQEGHEYLAVSRFQREQWVRPTPLLDSDGDDLSHQFTGAGVTLDGHCGGVAELARNFGLVLGLGHFADDLRLVGELHDRGKADPRFQQWLLGGDPVAAAMATTLLAKSTGRQTREESRRARHRAAYPRGMRHELLSVALIRSNPSVLKNAVDAELVTYLVAAHHGYCRTIAPPQHDDHPVAVTTRVGRYELRAETDHDEASLAGDVARSIPGLIDRYGWYGLAWLETIVRLADHRRSAAEEAGA